MRSKMPKSIIVQLFEPDTLVYVGDLLRLENVEKGIYEDELQRNDIEYRGSFYGLIIAELDNGEIVQYEAPIYLP